MKGIPAPACRLAVVAICALACLCAPSAAHAAGSDSFAGAPTLDLFTGGNTTNLFDYTTESSPAPGEMLTNVGPYWCNPNIYAVRTAWFKIQGNGRQIGVSASGPVQLLTSVFSASPFSDDISRVVDCRYDGAMNSGAATVTFNSEVGKTYYVQVGICRIDVSESPDEYCNWPGAPEPQTTPGTATPNALVVAVSGPPPYDTRANAAPLVAGKMYDNHGATVTDDTIRSCNGHEYGATVWFKWTSPTWGTASFTLRGMPGYVSIRRAGNAVAACGNGSARARVSKGETVFLQIGTPQLAEGLYNEGHFTIGAAVLDPDDDNDQTPNARDCQPLNRAVHPGVPEIQDNGVDEDCDPSNDVNMNRDGDPVPRPRDCDDGDDDRYPGNEEIRGNGHDEDCNPKNNAAIKPPTTAGFFIENGRLTVFVLNEALKGSRVVVRCAGAGCADSKRVVARNLPRNKKHLRLPRSILRSPAAGTRVRVEVSNPPEWLKRRFEWRLLGGSSFDFDGLCRKGGKWRKC